MSTTRHSALISVIIPFYNTLPYLKRCLNSIARQSYARFEVIIVNDGSTANQADEINQHVIRITGHDNRFKTYHQPHQGAGIARNLGLAKAKGEYIAFVDSDDYIEADYLRALYEAITHNNALIASCCVNVRHQDYVRRLSSGTSAQGWQESIKQILALNDHGVICNHLYHRSLFDGVTFPPGSREDTPFIIELLIKNKINNHPQLSAALYNYVATASSTTRSHIISEQHIHDFVNNIFVAPRAIMQNHHCRDIFADDFAVWVVVYLCGFSRGILHRNPHAYADLKKLYGLMRENNITLPGFFRAFILLRKSKRSLKAILPMYLLYYFTCLYKAVRIIDRLYLYALDKKRNRTYLRSLTQS